MVTTPKIQSQMSVLVSPKFLIQSLSYLSFFKDFILVFTVKFLHKLFLIPIEVVEEYPDGGCGDLGHFVNLIDALNHVIYNILYTQHLKNNCDL